MNLTDSKWIRWLPYLTIFIASFYPSADLDLGWHLKYGEYFFKTGEVLKVNLFSNLFPGFYWANTSWGSDVLLYFIYSKFGFLGISFLGTFVVTFSFYFFSKASKLSFWDEVFIFPLILYLEKPVIAASYRVQLLSLLFLGVLYFVLRKFSDGEKRAIYFLIPLFLFWSNLHGQFILGFIIFGIWIVFYFFSNPKLIQLFIFTFILCFLSTLINPYGLNIYFELLNHSFGGWQKYIIEWIPFEKSSVLFWNLLLGFALMVAGVLFIISKGISKNNLSFIAAAFLLGVPSFFARRYAWLYFFTIIPLIKPLVSYFKPKNKLLSFYIAFGIWLVYSIFVIRDFLPLDNYLNMDWNKYCLLAECSPKAAEFILSNNLHKRNLLTFYNFGGWLIWNYPEIKPTIDGRMPSWKEKGLSPFVDYYNLEQNKIDINKLKFNVVWASNRKPLYYYLVRLSEQGSWKLVYQDQVSGIFVRN